LAAVVVAGCTASGAGPDGGGGGSAGSIVMTGVAGTGGVTGTGAAGAGGGACPTPPTAHMSWQLSTGNGNGPFVSCAQAGVATLEVFMNSTLSEFTCTAQSGTTGPLTGGSYTPRVLLRSAQMQVVFQSDFPNPVTISSCGVTDLGALVLLVNTSGATGAAGGGGTAGTTGSAGATGTAGAMGGTGPCNAMPIFAVHQCAYMNACHDSKGTAAGFDMATSGWETTLVGRKPKAGGGAGFNSQCLASPEPFLVAGSAPARGLFLDKLAETMPPCGNQMPALPPLLTPSELDCVQRWANALTK